ncbi:MAG: hypothetical protein H8E31_00385, partial [Planctomycetes bacterium]|nr:hypothetical protein [Planctomycetota bacterium]
MGHLGHLKEEYQDLVQRLDAGQVGLPEPSDPVAWQGWKELLVRRGCRGVGVV